MLDYKDLIPCCTGMIQKEVAERIAAGPGSKTYGILSVLIQAWYKVEYLFTVHEHVFNPPPKVKSAVIRMTRNETTELGCDEKLFKQIVKPRSTSAARPCATQSLRYWKREPAQCRPDIQQTAGTAVGSRLHRIDQPGGTGTRNRVRYGNEEIKKYQN